MTVAKELYIKEICEGILAKILADLGTELQLDDDEPTYYGYPTYIANYPCLVMIPPLASIEGYGGDRGASRLIGDLLVDHQLVYIDKIDEGIDPYPHMADMACRLVDWLIASMVNREFPQLSGEDLFHFYVPPYRMRLRNEYDDEFRSSSGEAHHLGLRAVVVEFGTRKRQPLSQL